jgi:hypothetical protein
MKRSSRTPANSLLRTAKEAFDGPCRFEAGALPGRAIPRSGTFRLRLCRRYMGASSACAVLGAQAASATVNVQMRQYGPATHQCTRPPPRMAVRRMLLLHSAIAIYIAGVLNSSRALTAPLTGKLTRHERRPNRTRDYTEARWGSEGCPQRYSAPGNTGDSTPFRDGRRSLGKRAAPINVRCRNPHRKKLRGLAASGHTALP